MLWIHQLTFTIFPVFPIVFFLPTVLADFSIPIPFGTLTFNKKKDGKVDVNIVQDADILGFGGNRNTTLTVGNGSFVVDDERNALVNGTEVGGQGAIGFDKNKGVIADAAVNLGNETIEIGPGKEGGALSAFFGRLSKFGKKKN